MTFNKGDRIMIVEPKFSNPYRSAGYNSKMLLLVGNVYTIAQVTNYPASTLIIVEEDNSLLIHSDWAVVVEESIEQSSSSPSEWVCNCPSNDLFWHGCRCKPK